MIAAAPHHSFSAYRNRDLEYLLLGDLRQTLEEPAGPQKSRWLLAILDMILVGQPRVRPPIFLPVHSSDSRCHMDAAESDSLVEKLRRLRDRVAHRSDHFSLANEIREELREVMLDRVSSAACMYDA